MGDSGYWELADASTNPDFGSDPRERSLDQLLAEIGRASGRERV